MSAAEIASLAILALTIVGVLWRPRGVHEAYVAAGGGLLVLAGGLLPLHDAVAVLDETWEILLFLLAITAVAVLADAAGVFESAAFGLLRRSREHPVRLWFEIFAFAVVLTVVFSLDGTAVLLTPIVARFALTAALPLAPYAFCVVYLANTASLMLPISNLTNLLAASTLHVGIGEFFAVMGPAGAVAIALTAIVLYLRFRKDLRIRADEVEPVEIADPVLYRTAIVACVALLPGFIAASLAGVALAFVALPIAIVLGAATIYRRSWPTPASKPIVWRLVLFIVGLYFVVAAARVNGLATWLGEIMGAVDGGTALDTLATSGIAAVASALLNNLPAYLALAPSAAGDQLYAVLVGTNIGPLLSPIGSIATLLWFRLLQDDGPPGIPTWGGFIALGVVAVPAILVPTALVLAFTS